MANRNSKTEIKQDIEHLQAMRENAQKLHDKEHDIETTEYLLRQIDDWIKELQDL